MEFLPQNVMSAFICGVLVLEAILFGAVIRARWRSDKTVPTTAARTESPLIVLTSMVVEPGSVAQVQRDNNRFFPAEAVARLCEMLGGELEATGRLAERQLGILKERHPGKTVLLEVVRRK